MAISWGGAYGYMEAGSRSNHHTVFETCLGHQANYMLSDTQITSHQSIVLVFPGWLRGASPVETLPYLKSLRCPMNRKRGVRVLWRF